MMAAGGTVSGKEGVVNGESTCRWAGAGWGGWVVVVMGWG